MTGAIDDAYWLGRHAVDMQAYLNQNQKDDWLFWTVRRIGFRMCLVMILL
jgi:hypothetical protein